LSGSDHELRKRDVGRPPWLVRAFRLWRDEGLLYIYRRAVLRQRRIHSYDPDWIKAYEPSTPAHLQRIEARIAAFAQRPLFTIVLPRRNASAEELRQSVQSVQAQLYGRWELCIAGDNPDAEAGSFVESLTATEARIRTAHAAGGTATALNQALAAGHRDYVVLLRPGDRLAPHALYLIGEEINACAGAAIVYSDEDTTDADGRRRDPQFKSDWNPDLLLSRNYVGSLVAWRDDLVRQAGSFRDAFDTCLDYDLTLRVVERRNTAAIRHIPWVLYHARSSPTGDSRGPDAATLEQERGALREHLARVGIPATVEASRSGRFHRVRRPFPATAPRVSLIIPTRDRVRLLRAAVDSILTHTDYPNYEIVIIDNQSVEAETAEYFASLAAHPRVRVLEYDFPFNYSALNNFGAARCEGELLGFVNNDIEAIHDDWLTEMVSHATRPEVGAVGPMLYFPDGTVQSAGILVGVGVASDCATSLPAAERPPRYELIQNYSAVTGACLLTRAALFREVGGFNEADLSVAYNDVDYCLKLRERGYLVTWTPYAELVHHESASRGSDKRGKQATRLRHEQRYLARWWPHALQHDPYYNPHLSRATDSIFALSRDRECRPPWF